MADRRRGKQKRQQDGRDKKPGKEEKAVAKYLRFNVPIKEGKLVGMPVQYFIASDAVNSLLSSKWTTGKDPLFTNRASVIDYCNRLLYSGMYHRAAKVERRKEKDRDKKRKKVKDEVDESGKEEEKRAKKRSKKREKEEEKKEESEAEKDEKKEKPKDTEETEKKDEEKKRRRKEKKIKLEMVDQQYFKDGEEIYVWIYDPVPLKTFFIGLFLVLGAIGVCLFPLWPPEVRLGVYYLSLSVAGCIGFLLVLCVVRVILFCLVWGVTFGRHHFWFLPNLNEDVGFINSFQPAYFHEYVGGKDKTEEKKKAIGESEEEGKEIKEKSSTTTVSNTSKDTVDKNTEIISVEEDKKTDESGTGSELDNDNGYEIVDADDLPAEEDNAVGEGDVPPEGDGDTEPKKTK